MIVFKTRLRISKVPLKMNIQDYLMPIKYGWRYLEDITLKLKPNQIIMHRSSPIPGGMCLNEFSWYLEAHLVDCTITVTGNETVSQPTLLSSLNPNRQFPSIQQDIWYDRVAILSTRGFANIYHNTEWIMNFVHFASVSNELPLVRSLSFFYL